MASIDQKLKLIVGNEFVTNDSDIMSEYFFVPPEENNFRLIFPETVEALQRIIKLASDEIMPVFSTYDTYFPDSVARHKRGILLDFKRMNKIERIDPKNLVAHIQRGVTFEQLIPELKRHDIKLSVPASATSKSVVEQYVSRAINMRAARYPEVAVSNMKVVLPDGKIQLTGSHALSEDASDHKADGGPNLSQWYLGGDDIFGIVARASIWTFPIWNTHEAVAFGFDAIEEASAFIREMPRRELCTMGIAMNKKEFMQKAEIDETGLPPWIAILVIEGVEAIAAYRKKIVYASAMEKGLRDLSELIADKYGLFETPWYVNGIPRLGFYCNFDRITEFNKIVVSGCSVEDVGIKLVSVSNGGCVWLEYQFPQSDDVYTMVNKIGNNLVEKGAFFDRPSGKLADSVYSKLDGVYINHLKRIKNMIDPVNIINPGIPIEL